MKIHERYLPYLFIAVLCVIIAVFRFVLIPEFAWYIHLAGFFLQLLFMSLMWQLIKFINAILEKQFSMEKAPATQISLQVFVTLLLLSPIVFTGYYFFKPYLPAYLQGKVVVLLSVVIFMVIMLMTFVYYTYTLFLKQKKSSEESAGLQLMAARLEKEASMMRFHHLKNQVNPHFLFNTFSSLDGLVKTDPQLASDFIRHLSKVYRYVLEHKENEVVSLETEIAFIRHYISLLQIRYANAIAIDLDISTAAMEKGIVMVTLQMLIDNAVKHNIVQAGTALKIRISDAGDYLHVANNKQLRKQIETSNQQGLKQLQELYSFLTDKPVLITETELSFEINLPLL